MSMTVIGEKVDFNPRNLLKSYLEGAMAVKKQEREKG
jgi:hypothetical protein